MNRVAVLLGFVLAACRGEDDNELENHQGLCNDLGEAACKSTTSCQQVYEDSGFQPAPNAVKCLLIKETPSSSAACESLSYDACRTRNDCALLYWQDLGPDDGPVGDPYYKNCVTETEISAQ